MKIYKNSKINLIIFLFIINLIFLVFKLFALESLENLKNNYDSFFKEYQNQAKTDINIANKYLYDYVKIAIYLNKQEEAANFLRSLINKNNYNPFFLQNLANSFFILNDLESSKKTYLNLIDLLYNSDINSISSSSKDIISNSFLKLANIEYINGNINNYFKYLKNSIYFDSDYYSVLKKKIMYLKDWVIFNSFNYDLNDVNKIQQIINNEIYDKNINEINLTDDILFSLADLYYSLYITSLNDFYKLKALEYINNIKNKNNIEIYYLLINLEDNEEKRIEIIKQVLDKFNNVDPYFYEQLGDYYYKKQDFDDAINYYLKLINAIPTKKDILYKIAYIYYNKKEMIKALNYINLALKLDDNPDYYYFKGEILLALNDLDNALQSFELAYEKYSDISLKAKSLVKIKDIKKKLNK
ncbi:MAG: tetratricopeptide repeat protein [bacterium]